MSTRTTAGRAYVAYCRVSTDRQGRSGLGLEAQRAAIDAFLRTPGSCCPPMSKSNRAALRLAQSF
jgi:hypothetical protein